MRALRWHQSRSIVTHPHAVEHLEVGLADLRGLAGAASPHLAVKDGASRERIPPVSTSGRDARSGGAGGSEDVKVAPAYAAKVWFRTAFQFQGINSCTRVCGNGVIYWMVHPGGDPACRASKERNDRNGPMMEYKGYLALVEFDDSTGVLHGRAVDGGPYPAATFEATDTRALRREFERSVDECFEWCERTASNRGRCAEDWLRLEAGLHAAVEMEARAEGMSVVLGSSGRFERRS